MLLCEEVSEEMTFNIYSKQRMSLSRNLDCREDADEFCQLGVLSTYSEYNNQVTKISSVDVGQTVFLS